MYLYIYEGFKGGADRHLRTEELVNIAVDRYAEEKNISFEGISREICRTEKGKPYFKDIPVEFSVSHTDDLWVCLISDANDPVGVDVQKMKEIRQQRVAERYFTDDEKADLLEYGNAAFFKIWARKEAYAKYMGSGLTKELAEISTLNNREVEFIDFYIRAGVTGSCCVKEKEGLCIRTI